MLGDRIRELRNALGLTQAQLAEKIGVSKNTVFNWENAKRQPRENELRKLATVLNVSVAYIMGETNNPAGFFSPKEILERLAIQNMVPNEGSGSLITNALRLLNSESESKNKNLPESSQVQTENFIVFERGEGSNKVIIKVPLTDEVLAMIEKQIFGDENDPRWATLSRLWSVATEKEKDSIYRALSGGESNILEKEDLIERGAD